MRRIEFPLSIALLLLLNVPTSAQDGAAPTAVIDAPNGIDIGAALQLSGARSSDMGGGRIIRYIWTRLEGSGGGMAINAPIATATGSYQVPQPPGHALAPGRHRFRLVVQDDSGNQSQPAERQVVVADRSAPTAVVSAPRQVTQIQPFQLSGANSTDVGGRIVSYQWTRIDGGAAGPMPLGQPLVTDTNTYTVAQSLTSYLAVGRHRLRLVVVDDSGNQSAPTDVTVDIVAPLPSGRSN